MNKTISVYFSGTGFSITTAQLLASSLYERTKASETQIKMGFNGCGVDYGFRGLIFGRGLDEQCAKALDCVVKEIKAGHQITLNVYGHSRGGIAALLLAKQLGDIDKEKLSIHLALLDPVPGNFIFTSSFDPFQISLANKTMDLSDCKPLRKVLALYPHQPLPAILCHAPLLASYPPETEVQEEVVNGCHSQVENISGSSATLVKMRVEEFLVKNGTQLQTDIDYHDVEAMKNIYLSCYKGELARVTKAFYREAHSNRGLAISATSGAEYLNSHHKALAGDDLQKSVSLSIQIEKGIFSGLKRFFMNHPLMGQAMKWTLLAFLVASALFFTGGLATISFLSPMVAKLGALSALVFSPVMGITLSATWYGAVKPILSWCASKFFYPQYAMLKLNFPKTENDSTRSLKGALGVGHSTVHPSEDLVPYQGKFPLSSPIQEELQQSSERKSFCSFR